MTVSGKDGRAPVSAEKKVKRVTAKPTEGTDRGVYRTFDGLRGLAALLVATRHLGPFLGPLSFPESFLAVDLFFLLSGFVVARAYEPRLLAGGFFRQFLAIRLIRLYPLYLAGLGFALLLRLFMLDKEGDAWTMKMIVETAALALLMAPGPKGATTGGYSLNSPSWTLLPEIALNLVYAAVARHIRVKQLWAVIGVCAAGLVLAGLHHGTLDLGYTDATRWAVPFRMGFSFLLGVVMYRLTPDARVATSLKAVASIVALGAGLMVTPPPGLRLAYEFALVFLVFPPLVLWAAHFEPKGRIAEIMGWIGGVSYAIYTVHEPLGRLLYEMLHRLVDFDVWTYAPLSGLIFLSGLCLFATLLDRAFDRPTRKALSFLFLSRKP